MSKFIIYSIYGAGGIRQFDLFSCKKNLQTQEEAEKFISNSKTAGQYLIFKVEDNGNCKAVKLI